jgi:hypothetical protein
VPKCAELPPKLWVVVDLTVVDDVAGPPLELGSHWHIDIIAPDNVKTGLTQSDNAPTRRIVQAEAGLIGSTMAEQRLNVDVELGVHPAIDPAH